MVRHLLDRLKFMLERWIQSGALYQLLLMAFLVAFVALAGGLLAWALTDAFANPAEAIWWSFLRLTDPGYLGDDEGAVLRTISTLVTVLGYVLFMGSLIAIMTQWLFGVMRTLESGLTPVSFSDHFLILGWTNRTPSIVQELVLSKGRVKRFLRRRGEDKLRIVILAEDVNAELHQELRDLLGKAMKRSEIILRLGSSMRVEHLQRVNFTRAAAIIIPGADHELGGPKEMDSRVIKTLMSISKYGHTEEEAHEPVVVAEIFDVRKKPIARTAYPGQLNILAGDAFISRLIAQNIRHPGLSYVYNELLSHSHGNEVYVRAWPDLAGAPFSTLTDVFPGAVLLGVVRQEGEHFCSILNPAALDAGDRLVMVARSYEDTEPTSKPGQPGEALPEQVADRNTPPRPHRRILVLGWSQKFGALVQECCNYPRERFEIDNFSVFPVEARKQNMQHFASLSERVQIRHLSGDYTMREDLLQVEPSQYDNIIFLSNDWRDSSEEADARTILGYMLLRTLLPPNEPGPEVMVELEDPTNERLFHQRAGEVILSPVILSYMLAHAALRRELSSVFDELFGPQGAEIFFRSIEDYNIVGQAVDFRTVQRQAAAYGEIALGVQLQNERTSPHGGVYLNPAREATWAFTEGDKIVVLTGAT